MFHQRDCVGAGSVRRRRAKLLTQDQLDRYQPWFDNARRVRELLAQLEAASLSAMAAAEGWGQPD